MARVEVEGVDAVTADGFAHWTAEIPVRDGTNEYQVRLTDEGGEVTNRAATLTVANRGRVLNQIMALEMDAEREQVILADRGFGLVRLNLADGRVSDLSAPGTSVAYRPDFDLLGIDVARHRAIGATSFASLAGIDLESGEGVTVSEWTQSVDFNFSLASGLTIDAEHDRAFVLGSGSIVAVELATGAQSLLAAQGFDGSADGEGLDDIVYDAVTDPEHPQLLISDRTNGSVIAVDPMDGTTTPWLTGELRAPSRMKLDAERRRLLVVDGAPSPDVISNEVTNQRQLVAVDLVERTSRVLSGPGHGAGYVPSAPYGLALDATHERAYIADRFGGRVSGVELRTGDRTLVIDSNVGVGLTLDGVTALLLWPPAAPRLLLGVRGNAQDMMGIELANGNRSELPTLVRSPTWARELVAEPAAGCARNVLALDSGARSVVRLDLGSGEQTIITSPDTAEGPLLGGSNAIPGPGLALDAVGGRVLASNGDEQLVAVDLSSGARTVMSDADKGEGPTLREASGVTWDDRSPSSPRALVATAEGIVAVNPTTGDREYLVAPDTGGPELVLRLALSPDGRSLVALTAVGLYSVDTTTGESKLLSGRATFLAALVGSGPTFEDGPAALQVDFERGIAYILDISLMAVLAVDLASGERVLASH